MTSQPPLDNQRNSLWRLFLTSYRRVMDRIEQDLAEADLPPLDWYDVLYTLKEAPECRLRLGDLAAEILHSRSNLTRLVDRLERAGLLRRESCPKDRRGTFAVLTEAGLAMQQRMWAVYGSSIAAYFGAHLDDDETKQLQEIFRRLVKAAKE